MVSIRCKMVVKSELEKLDLRYRMAELGEVELEENISEEKRDELRVALLISGLVLMERQKKYSCGKNKKNNY